MTTITKLKDEARKTWRVWTKEDGPGRSLLGLAKLALSSLKEETGEMPEAMMLDFKQTRVLLTHPSLKGGKAVKVKKEKPAKKNKEKSSVKKNKPAKKLKKTRKAK